MTKCVFCKSDSYTILVKGIKDWEYGVPGEYSYNLCQQCNLIMINPFPTIDQLFAAYPSDYPAYLDIKNQKTILYRSLVNIDFLFKKFKLKKFITAGAAVLDVGAGSGDFLMRSRRMGAVRLVGIDFNESACRLMRSKGIEAFEGVFLDYKPDILFDVIVMNNYIEHVLDPCQELRHALSLLKPGGVLIGTLPNFNGIDRAIFGKYWGGNHVPRHTFQFVPQSLRNIATYAGFNRVVVVQNINPSHVAISIQNFLQRKSLDKSKIIAGRLWYYNLLLLFCLPINLVFVLFNRSGVMSFTAHK